MGFVARLKWQMQFYVWLLQTAKISLLDVRKIRLLLLLSLEAFPEPSGMSTQDFPEACAVAVCGGFLQHVVLVVSATLDASGQVSMCPRPARGWSSGWPRVGASLHPAPSCPARLCLLHRHTQPAPCLPLISEGELLICECVRVCACSVVSGSLRPLWTVARQAPLSVGFSRQEHWSGLPCPPSGDPPDPVIESASSALADVLFTTEPTGKP